MAEKPLQPELFSSAPQPEIPVVDVDAIVERIGQVADTNPAYRERSYAVRNREADRMGLINPEDSMTTAQRAELETSVNRNPSLGSSAVEGTKPQLPENVREAIARHKENFPVRDPNSARGATARFIKSRNDVLGK